MWSQLDTSLGIPACSLREMRVTLLGHRGKAEGWSAMRASLQPVLQLAQELPPDELPEFLGDWEQIRVTAFTRLTAPGVPTPDDRLIEIAELAQRLNSSKDFVYRNQDKYRSFARPQGKKLLWSNNGLNEFIKNGHEK